MDTLLAAAAGHPVEAVDIERRVALFLDGADREALLAAHPRFRRMASFITHFTVSDTCSFDELALAIGRLFRTVDGVQTSVVHLELVSCLIGASPSTEEVEQLAALLAPTLETLTLTHTFAPGNLIRAITDAVCRIRGPEWLRCFYNRYHRHHDDVHPPAYTMTLSGQNYPIHTVLRLDRVALLNCAQFGTLVLGSSRQMISASGVNFLHLDTEEGVHDRQGLFQSLRILTSSPNSRVNVVAKCFNTLRVLDVGRIKVRLPGVFENPSVGVGVDIVRVPLARVFRLQHMDIPRSLVVDFGDDVRDVVIGNICLQATVTLRLPQNDGSRMSVTLDEETVFPFVWRYDDCVYVQPRVPLSDIDRRHVHAVWRARYGNDVCDI